jgi:hypothetical protein
MDLPRLGLTLLFSVLLPASRPDGQLSFNLPDRLGGVSQAVETPSQASAAGTAVEGTAARRVGTLPEATASFGAVASDGWLYVYGGHVSPTHSYSIEAVSGSLHRWNLSTGVWEALPGGPGLQGVGLAAHDGRIYRAGGMQPRNRKGEPEDQRSVDEAARFDPAARQWQPLPPLNAPRSSHDVVTVGTRLFAIGGWTMRGKESPVWLDTIEQLDLSVTGAAWKSLPLPVRRRAFVAATVEDRIYLIGGMDDRGRILNRVDIFDVARGTWSAGPTLPPGRNNGFSPAAATHEGRLYVSVADGSCFRLDSEGKTWKQIGTATPRVAHRLVADSGRLLVLGGADRGANLDLVEAIAISR